ncbi:MAG: hypothetical protein ACK5IJ_11860 [Mangrovibacterium sp.]
MNIMLKGILLLFFTIDTAYSNSCSLNFEPVPVYKIVDDSFKLILDNFVINEAQYEDFDSSTVLYINTMNEDGTIIQISSGGKSKNGPALDKFYMDHTVGIVFYKAHIILLYGRSVINSKIAKRTSETYRLKVAESDCSYVVSEDDSFSPTFWFCQYINDRLEIVNKVNRQGSRDSSSSTISGKYECIQ